VIEERACQLELYARAAGLREDPAQGADRGFVVARVNALDRFDEGTLDLRVVFSGARRACQKSERDKARQRVFEL
jgi:hypothetical protein